MAAARPSAISSAQSTIVWARNEELFVRDKQEEIRLQLKQKLPELGYHGKYYLFTGFDEELLLQGREHPEIVLLLYGYIEPDMKAIDNALSGIFAPHTFILVTDSSPNNQLPVELEDSDPSEILEPASESPNKPHDGSKSQPPNAAKADQELLGHSSLSNDYAMKLQADSRPEHELFLGSQLTVTTDPMKAEEQRTFGINFGITIEFHANESRNEHPKGAPDDVMLIHPWFSLNFTELRIWSDKNEQFSVSALHVHIEATNVATLCEIISPQPKNPISKNLRFPDVSIIDQWTIHTIDYMGRNCRRGEEVWEVGVAEVNYMDRDLTQAPSSIIGQLIVDEKYLPRIAIPFSATNGRSLRICVKALWKCDWSDIRPEKLRQPPFILSNFLHKATFDIDLERLIRGETFDEKLIQPITTHYSTSQVIEGNTDEVKKKKWWDLSNLVFT